MKLALLTSILSFTAIAGLSEYKDFSAYSMSAPELLTATRFAFTKEVQSKHEGNKFAHGKLIIVESGSKLVEVEFKGCGRPQRLNGSALMVSGCGFTTVYDLNGNKLIEKTTGDHYGKNQAVYMNGSVYIAGDKNVSVKFDLATGTETPIQCEQLAPEQFFAGEGKVFAQDGVSLWEITKNGCHHIVDSLRKITHLAQTKGVIAARFEDTNFTVMTFDHQNLAVIEAKNDGPVSAVTATSNVYPAANGGAFIFMRSIDDVRSGGGGWFPRTTTYEISYKLMLVNPAGDIVKKRKIGSDTTVISLTSTAGKHLVMLTTNNEGRTTSVELIDGTSLNTAWKTSAPEVNYTKSLVQSGEFLIGNRGEKLNARTGAVVSAPLVPYANEEAPSVLDAKNFMFWNYKSSSNGPGQWDLQYFLAND